MSLPRGNLECNIDGDAGQSHCEVIVLSDDTGNQEDNDGSAEFQFERKSNGVYMSDKNACNNQNAVGRNCIGKKLSIADNNSNLQDNSVTRVTNVSDSRSGDGIFQSEEDIVIMKILSKILKLLHLYCPLLINRRDQ